MKHFGIYLAYAPGVDLRHEGLGRYLAAFLKGAAGRDDVKFILVCPSWTKQALHDLFQSEGVREGVFEIVCPPNIPMILRCYEQYMAKKKRPKKPSLKQRIVKTLFSWRAMLLTHVEERLIVVDSFPGVLRLGLEATALGLLLLLMSPVLILVPLYVLQLKIKVVMQKFLRPVRRLINPLLASAEAPKEDTFFLRLYRRLEQVESDRMLLLINKMTDVKAWYGPTAFWPAFNKILAPRLMCVPDVVLADFPVGFSKVGGERFLQVYERVEAAIQGGQHFVTYSQSVKWHTLVERYALPSSAVSVVHHAPNDLSVHVAVKGWVEAAEAASKNYCVMLFKGALKKASNRMYSSTFNNGDVKFIFYASQFRPNKNLISLLKAYKYLLHHEFIRHKLILTGHAEGFPLVKAFIQEHHLENDVLCMHGLSVGELAACYALADLAVNPSLSEGGCPFTFTEALSVATPVVMARIPVTEEILVDAELQKVTFFDPYDWRDIADRIQWGLLNRDELLGIQLRAYALLSKRSWADVVNEHIDILEAISTTDAAAKEHALCTR
ncbi:MULTISPECIES: glycosyltransferase [Pseudomonas]|uniref:glycosyltransferase n=1 Tax=Pseudomonas TaxID=286 RepID=UPI002115AD2E|nr:MULTISPECIES: glycosyltransferase [unclassified Pseudomonas]MCV2226409.1 glycosyltransferase [Pseudomonas sp. AU10]